MIWKEGMVGLFKTFSRNLLGGAEENHGKPQSV
jgi:hypothetical protein